jgi:uncharacterized membrane protein
MRTVKQARRTSGGNGATLLGRGLGWFSVALGIAEIAAPRRLARVIGVRDAPRTRSTVRAVGARELASGVGILARPTSAVPLWSRVAGDALDLGLLGMALRSRRTRADRVMAVAALVVGVTALDAWAGRRLRRSRGLEQSGVVRSVTIGKPREEVYAFYRELERLPEFMRHVESVRELDERRSHWTVRLPNGTRMEWDAEITEDRPGERLAWRTVEGSAFDSKGSVSFDRAPDGRGTEVHARMLFTAPPLARLFADLEVAGDLRRLKQLLETGEVVHSDASIHPGRHPARPSSARESSRTSGGGGERR